MSERATIAARAEPARQRGPDHRSVLMLVAVLMVAFAIALVLQVEARRRVLANLAIESQTAAAVVAAERMNTGIAQAWGAAAGAAEMAERTGALRNDPRAVAFAAARARPVRGVALYDSGGALIAATDRAVAALADTAYRESGDAPAWAGIPRMADRASAPVIVRRIETGAIVSILSAELLLADAPGAERALVATSGGQVLHASEALRREGLQLQHSLLEAAPLGRQAGAYVENRAGAWAVGSASTAIGDLRVVVASPASGSLSVLLQALAQFVLLAGAPLAAVVALVLLLTQNQRRVRLAEAEAERAEAHFRLAADSVRAGVFEWRSDEDAVQLSEQAAAMLQTEEDTLPLARFLQLAAPEDRATMEEEFRRARRTGALDLRFRVGAGASVTWIEARGVAIEDRAAPGPVRFIGSVLDATPRHEAEMRVSRLEKQLRVAIDSFSGPFALWDQRRRLMLWNNAYAKAFQLGPELLRPRASYEALAIAAGALVKRERVHPVDPQIREIELASGEWLHLIERRTSDGGLISVGVDITALKRQEEELKRNDKRLRDLVARLEASEDRIKEARQRAEEANMAKSAFLANMSHELRTPLTHIIGFSEIMANELFGPIANEQYRQYANDIFSSGSHLLDLINDILDMAKIEAGKMSLAPHPLDPRTAIEQAVSLTRRRADEKNLQIIVDCEGLPEIEADHRAVKQMLINLLSNAIKFTDEGAVMVRGRPTAEGIVIRVVDTGCGIPADQLPRLARPFEQVETELARNHSGTGLGLALTKSLAEMHGGRLTIESEVGKGTIVSIFLPRHFLGEADAARTAAE